MMRWSLDVFKWIRPHHLIETIKSPQRAVREIKYRYTFTNKKRFLRDLVPEKPTAGDAIFSELHQKNLMSCMQQRSSKYRLSSGRGAMGGEAELLYGCVRLIRPDTVVETGVGAGISSTFILEAMHENNHGRLYSIDYYRKSERSGWAVPDRLKGRWQLIRGISSHQLPPLLADLRSIDLFLHDSDHSYANMLMEFRTTWPYIKNRGLLLAHDVGRNAALFDFLAEVNYSFRKVRTFPVLAGLRKM